MSVPGRVIVVGSVNVDLVASVEWLPAPGETVTGATFARHSGGKGGNQATAASRLGAHVLFVGAVGDDAFGVDAREALRTEAVEVSELATVPGATGVALILVDARGENVIAVSGGANGHVTADRVEGVLARATLSPADVVLVSNEIPVDAVRAALRLGREAGATTVLNPAPAAGLDGTILEAVDIVVPNLRELAELIGGDRPARHEDREAALPAEVAELAGTLLAAPERTGVARAVIVTLGAEGAVLITGDRAPVGVPAAAVEAVDTVGAGDTFVGSLGADLAAGRDLETATRRAVAAAGLSTTRPGARGGMPTAAELDRFLTDG
ncbi:MAG TPA: ribokinase [Candidatus Limnocylindrales bacterium]|jgi:ribokinase|nr:ribokinase [Candidatus Limnocylindrales bacterium]